MRRCAICLGIIVAALATPVASPIAAAQSARTGAICKQPLEARRALAKKNDPDGVYCLAVLYAYRYGDETYPSAERKGYRADAIALTNRAATLGYRVKDLRDHITGGDNITNTGSYYGHTTDNGFGRRMGCQSSIGTQCSAQCAGDQTCYYSCTGGNAWRCK